MNHFIGTQVFARNQRSLLVFRFRREGQDGACDYLYKSQLRYILSQLQLEFMEYRCRRIRMNYVWEAVLQAEKRQRT